MQDLTSLSPKQVSSGSLKVSRAQRYFTYFLIAILAYFAGDQKLLQDAFSKLGLPSEIGTSLKTSNNEVTGSNQIYYFGKYTVTNVVDGDTVNVLSENGEKDTVRIIAVDTMEMNDADI